MKVEARITLFTVNDDNVPTDMDIDIKVQIVKDSGPDKRKRSLITKQSGPRSNLGKSKAYADLITAVKALSKEAMG